MRILPMLCLFLLCGCANSKVGWGGTHEVVLANEAAITVVYDPMVGGYHKAQEVSTEHCKKYGKSPVPTVAGKAGILPTQTYECR